MPIFCPQCTKANPDSAQFCARCGKSLEGIPVQGTAMQELIRSGLGKKLLLLVAFFGGISAIIVPMAYRDKVHRERRVVPTTQRVATQSQSLRQSVNAPAGGADKNADSVTPFLTASVRGDYETAAALTAMPDGTSMTAAGLAIVQNGFIQLLGAYARAKGIQSPLAYKVYYEGADGDRLNARVDWFAGDHQIYTQNLTLVRRDQQWKIWYPSYLESVAPLINGNP